jgi:4-methylaminobutanoate oxidase (formaldehyde-forming)
VQFRLRDSEPILVHNEGIVRDGEIVGILTSGAYGHALGGAVGLGYVPCAGESPAQLLASRFEIEIAGTRVPPRPPCGRCTTQGRTGADVMGKLSEAERVRM